ncbi:type I-C CRISPR-associated protein Cas8c/Csd1 [Paenibacillus sp. JCM 10914]|uniref:type I-C CRISPR-associated protein Cas8c/Csd1 n=1 Tax=Paenibacillus sp. JCM 10914 TaxID=1236974 RepID=UPI0003CCB02F|nr:type I-C CRISPR-associated protein Cas8c/Csd1 [Paenibacillus sp. JCM 10914]GAE10004.1 CRISPR-associated protein, CT1133 family [Paenibacillus sp. JCM 10914]
MSWLLNLYETYESNLDRVGEPEFKNDREFTLLPVSHTTQNAHIEVLVTEDGEFHSAEVIVDKKESSTLIPSTEKSSSRAGSVIAPYPLHDKLIYVAGDFVSYGGKVKGAEPFETYIQELQNWAESKYAVPKVKSIYHYLSKRTLIRDLVAFKNTLAVDREQKLIEKWDSVYEELFPVRPAIFGAVAGDQSSAFIRFTVHSPDRILTKVWKDAEMYSSFLQYYQERLGDEDVCYVTGRLQPSTERHANKIRNAADKAKLISANDTSGFTFRGRFIDSKDAANISYEVSQKAHNALKWLINLQAKIIDERVFLVWGNDALFVPEPTEDTFSLDPEEIPAVVIKSDLKEGVASELAKSLDGYRNKLQSLSANIESRVNIIVLDSATTGRMAVLYYRNMDKEIYFNKLLQWHTSCAWLHRYRKNDQGQFIPFYGAPATRDIAFAAYGPRADDRLVKGLMERMLPCIIDGVRVPKDIINSVFQRASNPVSMEIWEWEKTLSIACALINKDLMDRQEGFELALELDNDDRSYLFGRMLAVADVLERRALGDEKRATNAIRYMNAFAKHPERTWQVIQAAMQPYQARLGKSATYWTRIIDEIGHQFKSEDFNNKALSGKYLLGYYSQRHALYQKKDAPEDVTTEETIDN